MTGRDPRSETTSHDVVYAHLLSAIDSQTIPDAEEARFLVEKGLKTIRGPSLLDELWEYYVETNSINAAKLLSGVSASQSERLFEKLNEGFLKTDTRLVSLDFLGYLIRRMPPPSWLHNIVQTPLFLTLLRCLKSEYNVSILMGALLATTALLPSIPVAVGPYLRDLCDIFMRLIAWLCSTYLGDVPEVLMLHLHVGIYAYFHRLYAMYPNHLIQYLQTQYNSTESQFMTELREVITPYLESVRFHPFLVIGNRQSETLKYRWNKRDAAAIVGECSKLCLDPSFTCSSIFQDLDTIGHEPSQRNTLQLARNLYWRRQPNNPSERTENGSIVDPYFQSPSQRIGLITPPMSATVSPYGSHPDLLHPRPSSDTDSALSSRTASFVQTSVSTVASQFSVSSSSGRRSSSFSLQETSRSAAQPFNGAHRGSQRGNYVNVSNASTAQDSAVDHTLSSSPRVVMETAGATLWYKPSRKADQCALSTTAGDDSEDDTIVGDTLASSVKSQTAHHNPSLGAIHQRSVSWDAGFPFLNAQEMRKACHGDYSSVARPAYMWQSDTDLPRRFASSRRKSEQQLAESGEKTATSAAAVAAEQVSEMTTEIKPEVKATSGEDEDALSGDDDGEANAEQRPSVFFHVSTSKRVIRTFSHLLPSALPIPAEMAEDGDEDSAIAEMRSHEGRPNVVATVTGVSEYQSLSPIDLLDRHLELGQALHAKEGRSVPMTYMEGTDWSHFGESPQADEVAIVKSQLLLLHAQLMYERHLRKQHDQRNRSLLQRSHQADKVGEELWSLRNQLEVRNKEIEMLQVQVKVGQDRERAQWESGQKMEKDLRVKLREFGDEIQILTESEAAAVKETERLRQDVQELTKKLELAIDENFRQQREIDDIYPKVKVVDYLQSQVDSLSQELLYVAELFDDHLSSEKDRLGQDTKSLKLENEFESLKVEQKATEELIRQQTAQLEKYKVKIDELEAQLKNKVKAFEQQQQLIDDIKSRNEAQLKAVEEKCAGLKVANQYLESHIMELYGRLDHGHRVGGSDSSSLASTPRLSFLFSRSPDDPHASGNFH